MNMIYRCLSDILQATFEQIFVLYRKHVLDKVMSILGTIRQLLFVMVTSYKGDVTLHHINICQQLSVTVDENLFYIASD